jgi:hypothetical protein
MNRMRWPGTRLIQTNSTYGCFYFVAPGGHVSQYTAELIKRHPQVKSGKDALFPGMAQTWQIPSKEQL